MKNKIFIEFTVPHVRVVTSYLYTFVIYLYHNLQNLRILRNGRKENEGDGIRIGRKGMKKGCKRVEKKCFALESDKRKNEQRRTVLTT